VRLAISGKDRNGVELTENERSALEHHAACYPLPHREVHQAKLVLYAADDVKAPAYRALQEALCTDRSLLVVSKAAAGPSPGSVLLLGERGSVTRIVIALASRPLRVSLAVRRNAGFHWASDTLLAGGIFFALSPFGVPAKCRRRRRHTW
jgi:hypothetical protein